MKNPFSIENIMRPYNPDGRRVVETNTKDLTDIHNDIRTDAPLTEYIPFELRTDASVGTSINGGLGLLFLSNQFSQIAFGVIKKLKIDNVSYDKNAVLVTVDGKVFPYNFFTDEHEIVMNIPLITNSLLEIKAIVPAYPITTISWIIEGYYYNK